MSPSMIYSHHSSSVPPCASVTASVTASVCVRCVAYVWQRLADHRGSKTAAAAAGGQASVGTEATWPQAQRSEQLRPAASHFQPGVISTILRARSAGRLSRVGTQRVKASLVSEVIQYCVTGCAAFRKRAWWGAAVATGYLVRIGVFTHAALHTIKSELWGLE